MKFRIIISLMGALIITGLLLVGIARFFGAQLPFPNQTAFTAQSATVNERPVKFSLKCKKPPPPHTYWADSDCIKTIPTSITAERSSKDVKVENPLKNSVQLPAPWPSLPKPGPGEPILRHPPKIPHEATKSGHCRFDVYVNELGEVTDIVDLICSEKLFEQSAQNSAIKWQFVPKMEKGIPVPFTSADRRIDYRLVDEFGEIIPE